MRTLAEAPAAGWLETPVAEAPVEAPAEALAEALAEGVATEVDEVQPEPSLGGDVAGSASDKDSSELETKDEAGAREAEEEEDLFTSGAEDDGDAGNNGASDAPAKAAK